MPCLLRPLGQSGDRAHRVLTAGGDIPRPGEGRQEGFGEAPVAGVQLTDPLDHQAQATPRIRICAPLVDNGAAGVQLVCESLGYQRLLGREMTVQGGRPDPGTPRDLPHRHVQTVPGEQHSRSVEDAFAIVQRVRTQSMRQTVGHTLTLSKRTGASVTVRRVGACPAVRERGDDIEGNRDPDVRRS